MNVLMIENDGMNHYIYVKYFNRLMTGKKNHHGKKYFCMYCLQCFSSGDMLFNHKEVCLKINGKQTIKMPAKGTKIYFKHFYKSSENPFIIYADFESLLVPINTCNKPFDNSYTNEYQKHEICSHAYKVVCCVHDKYTKPVKIYRGLDAAYKFVEDILKENEEIQLIIKKKFNNHLEMTDEDTISFNNSTACWICRKEYKKDDVRVRDDNQVTGKYRVSTHKVCNFKFTFLLFFII